MNIRVKRAALFLFSSCVLTAAGPNLDQARKLYDQTDFDQSIRLLQAVPDKDASVHALLGRNYFMLSDYKKASDLLEKAVAADPQNAEYALWLGRAYGRRAETSSPFTAPGYASKTRQFLEKSVQLNPHDIEDMKVAITTALRRSRPLATRRMQRLRHAVRRHDARVRRRVPQARRRRDRIVTLGAAPS